MVRTHYTAADSASSLLRLSPQGDTHETGNQEQHQEPVRKPLDRTLQVSQASGGMPGLVRTRPGWLADN
jgi:hypothetical protein